jgi:superfamily II DNA or RNA helicase
VLWTTRDQWWTGARFAPRRWQGEALPAAVAKLSAQIPSITHAVMGSGKSLVLTELAATARPTRGEHVIVTTSSVALVDQLWGDLAARLGPTNVGRFYTHRKEATRPWIVCCDDSVGKLSAGLRRAGRRVPFIIADEAHRTECDTYLSAMKVFAPTWLAGFTATPFRDQGERLSLFHEISYKYGTDRALADGVVVPWKIRTWDGDDGVDIDLATYEMIRGAKGPGIVSAYDVADADRMAAFLTERGILAASLHYKSPYKRADVLDALKSGEIAVIVAVNMLNEGVDLPWLMWLALRRKMGSRVAFAQLVGRALRAHPGKEFCTLYDPWGLFRTYRLSYDAVLNGGIVEEPEEEPTQGEDPADRVDRDRRTEVRRARMMAAAESYLMQLSVALSTCGTIPPPRVSASSQEGASARQLQTIKTYASKLKSASVPPDVMAGLREVYRCRSGLSKASASDFLNIIFRLSSEGWPPMATKLMSLAA